MATLQCECGERIELNPEAGETVCPSCGKRYTMCVSVAEAVDTTQENEAEPQIRSTPLSPTMVQDLPAVTQFEQPFRESIVEMASRLAPAVAAAGAMGVAGNDHNTPANGSQPRRNFFSSQPYSPTPAQQSDDDTVPSSGAPTELNTGLRLLDRYEVQRKIGQGGMSTVYEAYDEVRGENVALKVLLPNLAANPVPLVSDTIAGGGFGGGGYGGGGVVGNRPTGGNHGNNKPNRPNNGNNKPNPPNNGNNNRPNNGHGGRHDREEKIRQIIDLVKKHKEKKKQQELQDLINSGGHLRDKPSQSTGQRPKPSPRPFPVQGIKLDDLQRNSQNKKIWNTQQIKSNTKSNRNGNSQSSSRNRSNKKPVNSWSGVNQSVQQWSNRNRSGSVKSNSSQTNNRSNNRNNNRSGQNRNSKSNSQKWDDLKQLQSAFRKK